MTYQHFQTHLASAEADAHPITALANLRQQIQEMHSLEERDWMLFQDRVHWETCPKGTLLLRPGQTCDHLRFLHQGAVIYYDGLDEETQLERVGWIAQPGEIAVEIVSFFQRIPTQQYMKCTVACAFLSLSRADLEALYAESAAWNIVGRQLAERYMLLMAERTHFLKLNSAREKYRYFTERFPQTMQLVSQRHIAAFLRIRPETLSRMRARRE
ncbi:MAG: Crp/Fnr family transcriptional regulator [Saprospiraceae bacterium]|nr:Crp/Fnr family transcriptional regulator [Saprospiraceae bacterium]